MSIIKLIKAAEWEIIDNSADFPTENNMDYSQLFNIILGILFVLSFFALAVSAVDYLKTKDEQKKNKAKKVMRRLFIIFTIVFVLSFLWFIILAPTIGLIGVS